MKVTRIILVFLIILIISCNSEDNQTIEQQEEPFTLELTSNNTNVNIDEIATFEINTNKPFVDITHSTDSFITSKTISRSQQGGFGSSLVLYVDTSNIGDITYSIRVTATDDREETATGTISFSVEKGNAVHIKEVLLNNFYNKDNTWDDEFSNNDVNRLADVNFSLSKSYIRLFSGQKERRIWYRSIIKENQGDLLWNLSQENLYVNPNDIIYFGLADNDGGDVGQDLLLGPPFEKEINLSLYNNTKPSTIKLSDSSIDLDVDFEVEW